jgi:hypothetical protein
MAKKKRRNSIETILAQVATEFGIGVRDFFAIAEIESSLNPKVRKDSYKGLFQLSDSEFKKYGGGNIFNAEDNARAAAKKWQSDVRYFRKRVGRDPSASDIYMMHQQGRAGYTAHVANPDQPAWKNIRPYYTDKAAKAKGFKNGDEYAKAAVWGNIPAAQRKKFAGGVDSVTSGDFTGLWNARVQRGIGRGGGGVANASGSAMPFPTKAPGDQRTFSSIAGGAEAPPFPGRRSTAFPVGGMDDIQGMMQSEDPRVGVHEANRHNPFPLEFSQSGTQASRGSQAIQALGSQVAGNMQLPSDPNFDVNAWMGQLDQFNKWIHSITPEQAKQFMIDNGIWEQATAHLTGRKSGSLPTHSTAPVPQASSGSMGPLGALVGSTGQTSAGLDNTFGQPFGALFSNQASFGGGGTSIPPPPSAPPVFKDLFKRFNFFTGGA